MTAQQKTGMGSHHSHGNGEKVWLTPPEIIERLGPFDLDPCFGSPRPWDTAAEHYGPDAADGLGGLHAPWRGMVWCNPPYDRHAGAWLARCAVHAKSGGDAIALTFARTETADFHEHVWNEAYAILFLMGRLYFHHPDGRRASANGGAPSVLVAYGHRAALRLRKSSMAGQLIDMRQQ